MRGAANDYWDAQGFGEVEQCAVPSSVIDAADLTSDDLGRLYLHHVAYLEYLERECALLDIDAAEAEVWVTQLEANIRHKKAGTVKDKDMKTRMDPEFVSADLDRLEKEAKSKLLRARLKSFERRASALSREMSRRQGDENARRDPS
jgi:hypothetical protein